MRAFEDGGFITVGLQPWRSPSEDLAPRHLLVSQCIMSSSSVHACLCLGVCIGESPRQQANKEWAAIWKYVWCGRGTLQVKQYFFASKYFVSHFFSVDSVLFCSLKTGRVQRYLENVTYRLNVQRFPRLSAVGCKASAWLCDLVPKCKPNEECFMISEACLWFHWQEAWEETVCSLAKFTGH